MKWSLSLLCLLSCIIATAQNELAEVKSGEMNKYISDGLRSHGLKFIFKYPKSFTAADDPSGEIVKRFGSRNSMLYITVSAEKLSAVPAESERAKIILPKKTADQIKSSGKLYSGPDTITINGVKWEYYDYGIEEKTKIGKETFVMNRSQRHYVTIYENYRIDIAFVVASEESSSKVKSKFDTYKTIFLTEMNTYSNLSGWNKY